MPSKAERHKRELTLRHGFFSDPSAYAAYGTLMRRVFDLDVRARDGRVQDLPPRWRPFAFFDRDGRCVACVEAATVDIVLDGRVTTVSLVRGVAVDPDWRGHGLFRDLMREALAWCESVAAGPTLLYSEDAALYEPFGFRMIAQHAFEGPAPPVPAGSQAAALDPLRDDTILLRGLVGRTPLSDRCALVDGGGLFLTNAGSAEDLEVARMTDRDAIIAYELDDEAIVLVDIVAAVIPPMRDILAALPARRRVVTLFPPDRLGWTGEPRLEDTGLMLRGPIPAAMSRPFMFPPTAEF